MHENARLDKCPREFKGVPRKNVRPLDGIPLIAWTIHTAKSTPVFSSVVVSTDSQENCPNCRELWYMCPSCGLLILQLTRRQFDTIKYTLSKLKSAGESYDCVAILQPTCPLRSREDIENCLHTMNAIDADTVITVRSAYGGLLKTLYHRHEDGTSVSLADNDDRQGMIRQQHREIFQRTGGVYLVKSKQYWKTTLFTVRSLARL